MNPTATPLLPGSTSTPWARALAGSLLLGSLALVGCGGGGGNGGPMTAPTVVGDTTVLTSTGRLLSFNRADPTKLVTTGTSTATNVVGGDLRPSNGKLYVLSKAPGTNAGTLAVLDPATGAVGSPVTLVADPADTTSPYSSTTGLSGTRFGVDFDPVVDRLRIVSDTGQNLSVDPATGKVITDAAINPAGTTMPVEAAYTNNLPDACGSQLLVVNATDGKLYTQSPQNSGTVGGATANGLGMLAPTDVVRFDIRTTPSSRADEAVATLNATVYGLDPTTGKATARGMLPLATGETIAALFVTGAPAGTTESGAPGAQQGALMSVHGPYVLTYNPDTPQKLCSGAVLGGLGTGEAILGTDYRPANGLVYALTSAAKVYALNPFTGALSAGTPLVPDPADTTSPFTDLTGLPTTEAYGVDFDPTQDRLRVISTSGRNYRVNVANGFVDTDTKLTLAGNTPVATAAAYTNSAPLTNGTAAAYAAPTASALYDIDSAQNHLYQQNPQNDGTLVDVGALGVAGGQMNGFDIYSVRSTTDPTMQTNTGYAALTVGSVTNLYTVNTATGAATLVNTIGPGLTTVSGLTRAK